MRRTTGAALLALAVCANGVLGCAARERTRPVKMGPVDTGAGSLEATRREFQGAWTLMSLEIVEANGARQRVKAAGRLTYDEFGNMTVRGEIEDDRAKSVPLEFTGRIVIDTAQHRFYAADLVSGESTNPNPLAAIAPDKVRQYDITPTRLTVTYLDAAGKPSAVALWERAAS